jgi:hypothetical protein
VRLTGGEGVGPVGRRASPWCGGGLGPTHRREKVVRHTAHGGRGGRKIEHRHVAVYR